MAYGVEITARAERDLADIYTRIQAETCHWRQVVQRDGQGMSNLDRYPKRAPIIPENRAVRIALRQKALCLPDHFQNRQENSTVYILHIRPPRRERMKKR